jgi:hypothetical protein
MYGWAASHFHLLPPVLPPGRCEAHGGAICTTQHQTPDSAVAPQTSSLPGGGRWIAPAINFLNFKDENGFKIKNTVTLIQEYLGPFENDNLI